jgi:hypothetical protein
MRKRKRHVKNNRSPLNQGKNAAKHQDQTQNDYDAFKAWVASGEASKPITLDELNRMLRLASKIE